MRIIPSNSSTAALRRIPLTLVDATDLFTPEDIAVTGVKVSLNINGGTPANSTNDIVKVAGSTGEYYLELTQSEANQTAGALIRGTLQPSGCALSKLQCQIGPSGVFAATVDANVTQIAGQTANAAAAVTFPATVASPTNITAASGIAVSSIANNALTAAATAVDFVAEVQSAAAAALAAYDGPTKAEMDTGLDALPTAAENAAALLAAASITPVAADTVQMNGAVVAGAGVVGNLWRGVP